jgi:hypothetical protein
MPRLQIIDQRRGVILETAVGIFHNGDHWGSNFGEGIPRIWPMNPEMRYAAIAQHGAHLHRIGGPECAVDPVHREHPFMTVEIA